jgi:TrmH family RNA methyltransferase
MTATIAARLASCLWCVILMTTLYGMPGIQTITSPANPLLRDVRRAVSRGERTQNGLCVAEGFHLLEEALRSGCDVPVVLASEACREAVERQARGLSGMRIAVLPAPLFQSVASTETPQGVIALVRMPEWSTDQVFRGATLVVALDGLQDPGNAGTIVRAAEAFGATGLLFLKGSVSPYHPKTLRASAGSLFRLPFVAGLDASLAKTTLRQHRVGVYAAMPYAPGRKQAPAADFVRRCAIVVGSEGRGISKELYGLGEDVAIPTTGVESLNAAVATSVLLYEASRQRREASRLQARQERAV